MSDERLEKLWNELYYSSLSDDEFNELIGYYKMMEIENKELHKKIGNAIEYIKSYLPNYDFDHSNLEKLLEILKSK